MYYGETKWRSTRSPDWTTLQVTGNISADGAGRIGATLNTAIDRYEYDSAGAILQIIILIVKVAEYASSYLRKFLQ